LDNPLDSFRLRELARFSNISPPSVLGYLKEFQKRDLVNRYEKRGVPFYKAERDNEDFKQYKRISILYELHSCGVVNYIWEKLAPSAIILYGSYVRGESLEGSDVDLFVVGKEAKVNLEKFEEKLDKEIHLMSKESVGDIPKELKNNLINGIVLKGYFEVFK